MGPGAGQGKTRRRTGYGTPWNKATGKTGHDKMGPGEGQGKTRRRTGYGTPWSHVTAPADLEQLKELGLGVGSGLG